jgi:hypothetical protein
MFTTISRYVIFFSNRMTITIVGWIDVFLAYLMTLYHLQMLCSVVSMMSKLIKYKKSGNNLFEDNLPFR